MRNLLLTLAYDGTGYKGWQRLPGSGKTVQESVEAALGRVLGRAVPIIGAGRTDAGVHAEGQAANFHTDTTRAPEDILEDVNEALPRDIACRSVKEVPERFHARYWAVEKTYRYRLHVHPIPDPFSRRYSLHVPESLDLPAMEAAAAELVGRRDFSAFANHRGLKRGGERDLRTVHIQRNGQFVDILFSADGFLYNQARIMAGALIEAGKGRLGAKDIRGMLERRDRAAVPGAAPAQGLCLVRVEFRTEAPGAE
ncbi:MAG: tRNA pseudouridine(38-40) synthase TruA [Treponema sp.]|nr:tRNA pseudouridine(38-40) synthase TruA [Treponema sp.]